MSEKKTEQQEVWIERAQFTRCDKDNHSECNNKRYLEYEEIKTGLSKEICSYGYLLCIGNKKGEYKYQWLPIQEAKSQIETKILGRLEERVKKLNNPPLREPEYENLYDVIYFYIEGLIETKRIITHFYPEDLKLIIDGICKRVTDKVLSIIQEEK